MINNIKENKNNKENLFTGMLDWLNKNGAELSNLDIIHYTPEHRGVVLNKNLSNNQVILRVPHKCIMSTVKANECNFVKKLKSSGYSDYSTHTLLALYLLEEKLKPDSFYKPYLNILPEKQENFPQFFNKNELDQLKGSFTLEMIRSRNLSIEKEYNEIVSRVPELGEKTVLRDYIWARISIVSRIFSLNLDSGKSEGLVPMADMLNHAKEPKTTWNFKPSEDSFFINSTSSLDKNNEVFDTYGEKCNSRYFVNYGFTLENNENNNQAVIFVNPKKFLNYLRCPLKKRKLGIIDNEHTSFDDSYCEYKFLINEKKEKLVSEKKNFRFQFTTLDKGSDGFFFFSFSSFQCAKCMFGFFRFLVSNKEELDNIIGNNKKFSSFKSSMLDIKPLNYSNELKTLKYIAVYCNKALNIFNDSLENDLENIKNTKKFSNRWNILNMLISEKKVLTYYRNLGAIINKLHKNKSNDEISNYLKSSKLYKPYYNMYWSKLK